MIEVGYTRDLTEVKRRRKRAEVSLKILDVLDEAKLTDAEIDVMLADLLLSRLRERERRGKRRK